MLTHQNCRYAIGCIYNLSTNAEVQDDLMRLKAVDTFMDLCEGESNTVISGLAVRSLRLLASNKTYRSQMSDELVPRLIQICKTSTSREILCEAALTLASLVTNPATLQLAAKQGILHALQRTQIVLAVNTPEWLPKIIRKVETVLAIWRRKSGRALVLANPTSRSFAGTATPHQRYRPTYDVVEYFRDVGMSGVDDSFNFAKEKIPSGARRFSYVSSCSSSATLEIFRSFSFSRSFLSLSLSHTHIRTNTPLDLEDVSLTLSLS